MYAEIYLAKSSASVAIEGDVASYCGLSASREIKANGNSKGMARDFAQIPSGWSFWDQVGFLNLPMAAAMLCTEFGKVPRRDTAQK